MLWKLLLVFTFFSVFGDFVKTKGKNLILNNKNFYYSGNNCYYLNFRGERASHYLYEAAKKFNSKVIRTWAFRAIGSLDGSYKSVSPSTDVYFQYFDPVTKTVKFNDGPNGLQRLDRTIFLASRYGIKLILTLTNNWKDFGGLSQYVMWFNYKNHDDFYRKEVIKNEYMRYIKHLLERKNIYSNITYKDDPTIMAWQLGNELRLDGDIFVRSNESSIRTITDWSREMSDYIKSIDKNHLVSIGDEGWFNQQGTHDWAYNGLLGVDVEENSKLPNIDFITFHVYPETWMKNLEWTEKWIDDHVKLCEKLNKPCIFAEYGSRLKEFRLRYYKSWIERIERLDIAGDNFWMISDRDDNGNRVPDYDGYTLYAIEGDAAKLVQEHGQRMINKN